DAGVATARHDELAARAEVERDYRALWIAQLLAAAGWTLRTGSHVMPHDSRAQQVEADDVIAQVGAKICGDGFCDLDRRKLDAALSQHVAGQRRSGDAACSSAVEQALDFSVALHPCGKTCPAGALTWREERPHQRKNAGRLDEQPGRAVRPMLPVQFGQAAVEIIVDQRDRQLAGTLRDAYTQATQSGVELCCALHVDCLNAHAA